MNGEPVPIWVADYVLISYGTGAIMAVPAHDERDFEFAKQFDIAHSGRRRPRRTPSPDEPSATNVLSGASVASRATASPSTPANTTA